MDNEKAVATLNDLIATLKDGEEGFTTAAEGLTDPQTKSLFQEFGRARGQMAQQLQTEVRALGGDPEQSGSMGGSLHRGWINIKSVVTGKDDASIVAEAERGEDIAKKAFDDAVKTTLPAAASALVLQLSAQIHATHDRVRAIERSVTR